MKCQQCGQEYDRTAKFCVECGAPLPTEPETPPQNIQTAQPAFPAYIRSDYNPTRDGRRIPYQSVPQPAPQPIPQPVYQPAPQPTPQPMPQPQSTGMVIFAVLNILCCGFGISFILGVIALIFAIMAGSGKTPAEARHNLKTAQILNFIGLGFIILEVIIIVTLVIGLIIYPAFDISWPGYMQ
jgi:hypothetical protein